MKFLSKSIVYTLIASFAIGNYSCSKDGDDDNATPYDFIYGGHSYQVVKTSKTWTEAAADAVAKGGYLVEIGSKGEQDAVYKSISNAGISTTYTTVNDGGGIAYIWIGATDRASEGSWMWNGANNTTGGTAFWEGTASGKAVNNSYVNWGGTSISKLNEPDNFKDAQLSPNGQNVAAIGLANWPEGSSSKDALGVAGEWNDIADTNKLYYVIEFDKE